MATEGKGGCGEMGGGGVLLKRIGDLCPISIGCLAVATRLENSPKLADLHSGAAFFSFFFFSFSFPERARDGDNREK